MIDFRTLFGARRPQRFHPENGLGLVPQMAPPGYDRIEPSGFIADGVISAAHIAAGAVTAGKLSVGLGVNLVPNDSFEYASGTLPVSLSSADALTDALPGWSHYDVTSGAVTFSLVDEVTAKHGDNVIKATKGATAGGGTIGSDLIPVEPSETLYTRGYIRGHASNTGNARILLRVNFYKADGTASATPVTTFSTTDIGTSTTWTQAVGSGAVPSDAHFARFVMAMSSAATNGDVAYVDLVELTRASRSVKNNAATVTIDEDGVTILDGALTFQDAYGEEVLTGLGFGSVWLRFIVNRVYNGDFQAGITTGDAAVSLVNTASTIADYEASLSPDIPGWVVEKSDGIVRLIGDSSASFGRALRMEGDNAGDENIVFQDIPVIPGEIPKIKRTYRFIRSSGDAEIAIYASYRDSDHAIIGSEQSAGLVYSTQDAAYVTIDDFLGLGAAPSNAAYLRYKIGITHNTTTGTSIRVSDVKYEDDRVGVTKQSTSGLTLTTSDQDVPGLTYTAESGRSYLVIWSMDFEMTTSGTGALIGTLYVDGSAMTTPQAIFTAPTATARAVISQSLIVETSPAGTGVIKVMGKKSINAGAASIKVDHSTMTVIPL